MGKDYVEERNKLSNLEPALRKIKCPTLFITGDFDESVPHRQSEKALELIGSKAKKLELIKGAGHCWRGEKQGEYLKKAVGLSVEWFEKWL